MWVILQNLVKILQYSSKNKLLLANSSALVASVGLNMLYLSQQITCPCILLRLACLLVFIMWVLPDYMYPTIFFCPYCLCLSPLACSLYERFQISVQFNPYFANEVMYRTDLMFFNFLAFNAFGVLKLLSCPTCHLPTTQVLHCS